MIRLLIVDDHPMAIAGLKVFLGPAAGIEVVGTADSVPSALAAYAALKPDVVLCDYYLPPGNGLLVVKQLIRQDPECKILIVSSVDTLAIPAQLLSAGALGYVVKASDGAVMIRAVRKVAKGQRYFDQLLGGASLFDHGAMDRIKGRLAQVMKLLAADKSTSEIALALGIKEGTVRRHKSILMKELRIKTEAELVAMAKVAGFGDPY
ncbi:response regulator [Lysobacter sp. CA199]|uniref:response regulator n=1 Tax=Lysobacter sp. CA199 TaxID=3455608 RepID=UPI003F8D0C9E